MISPGKAALYRYLLTALILGSGGLSSCFLTGSPKSDRKVKREEWRESRGPVVPHDSFPSDCTICHEKGSWHQIRKDFAFDHGKETGVEMKGAHAQAQCLRCHNDRGSVSIFASRGCAGCHDDIHRSRLGTQCTSCHSENNWNPTGIYAVHARTRFPLTGVHVGVACFRCHPAAESGQFQGADPRCEACHRNDAVQAKAFDHAAMGLFTNCQLCHSGTSWQNATFNHSFVAAGATCISCHQAKATQANSANTNHAAFGTDCASCHSTRTWAFFHNTPFPMSHRTAGGICAKCHLDVSQPRKFDCILCHETTTSVNRAKVDKIHIVDKKVAGYVYSNEACYRCHPTGQH